MEMASLCEVLFSLQGTFLYVGCLVSSLRVELSQAPTCIPSNPAHQDIHSGRKSASGTHWQMKILSPMGSLWQTQHKVVPLDGEGNRHRVDQWHVQDRTDCKRWKQLQSTAFSPGKLAFPSGACTSLKDQGMWENTGPGTGIILIVLLFWQDVL